jgi:cell division protein FtsQ
VIVALVVGVGYLWFRGSSFVRVEQVDVVGVSSSEGPEVTKALERAAKQMTTMQVSEAELKAAVADYTSVASLRVQAGFPHDLTIEVTERKPVATVDLGGESVAVGAGGRIMKGVDPRGNLPTVRADSLSSGGRLTDAEALRAVSVLAAAPAVLREKVARASWARKGLTLELRDGPLLIFGDASRPNAKWAASARVLADSSAAGAVYLDVRVPERVAAGGLGATGTTESDPLAPTAQGQTLDPQLQAEETPTLTP